MFMVIGEGFFMPVFFFQITVASAIGKVLLFLAGSLAVRVMSALGITLMTWGGVTLLVNTLIGHVQSAYASAASDMLSLALIGGLGDAIGIICGAFVTKAAFKSLNVFTGILIP